MSEAVACLGLPRSRLGPADQFREFQIRITLSSLLYRPVCLGVIVLGMNRLGTIVLTLKCFGVSLCRWDVLASVVLPRDRVAVLLCSMLDSPNLPGPRTGCICRFLLNPIKNQSDWSTDL